MLSTEEWLALILEQNVKVAVQNDVINHSLGVIADYLLFAVLTSGMILLFVGYLVGFMISKGRD